MTLVTLITDADVKKLKCIYFYLVNNFREMEWYGIECNKEKTEKNIEKAFFLLQSLSCTVTSEIQCEVKNFLNVTYSNCNFTDTSCVREITTQIVT